jgi:hypothetical protein
MNLKFLSFVVLFALSINASAQSDTCRTLGMVTSETEYDVNFGMEIKTPTLSPMVEQMSGQEIEVEGYIIPLSGKVKQSHFMYSYLPPNMCFFCGKAGPESAMQVFMKDKKMLAYTDQRILLKGRLVINTADLTIPMYSLENAEIIE